MASARDKNRDYGIRAKKLAEKLGEKAKKMGEEAKKKIQERYGEGSSYDKDMTLAQKYPETLPAAESAKKIGEEAARQTKQVGEEGTQAAKDVANNVQTVSEGAINQAKPDTTGDDVFKDFKTLNGESNGQEGEHEFNSNEYVEGEYTNEYAEGQYDNEFTDDTKDRIYNKSDSTTKTFKEMNGHTPTEDSNESAEKFVANDHDEKERRLDMNEQDSEAMGENIKADGEQKLENAQADGEKELQETQTNGEEEMNATKEETESKDPHPEETEGPTEEDKKGPSWDDPESLGLPNWQDPNGKPDIKAIPWKQLAKPQVSKPNTPQQPTVRIPERGKTNKTRYNEIKNKWMDKKAETEKHHKQTISEKQKSAEKTTKNKKLFLN